MATNAENMKGKIVEVALPEYAIDSEPNYLMIGKRTDAAMEENLADGRYVFRAIGKDDHPDLSIDGLVSIILESGTDKYDPGRKEICHDEFRMYDHDIQAGSFEIRNGRIVIDESLEYPTLFGDTAKKFFKNALLDRGYAVRIDILMIYDADKMERAEKTDCESKGARPELERCLYKFKDPNRKKDALVGIVKISR